MPFTNPKKPMRNAVMADQIRMTFQAGMSGLGDIAGELRKCLDAGSAALPG